MERVSERGWNQALEAASGTKHKWGALGNDALEGGGGGGGLSGQGNNATRNALGKERWEQCHEESPEKGALGRLRWYTF